MWRYSGTFKDSASPISIQPLRGLSMMLTQKYTSIIWCKHLVPSGTKCCHGINYKSNHNLVCGYDILSILICHSDHKNTTLLCQFFFFLGDLCCSLVACFRAPLPRILCLSSNRSLMTTPCMKNPTAVLYVFFLRERATEHKNCETYTITKNMYSYQTPMMKGKSSYQKPR